MTEPSAPDDLRPDTADRLDPETLARADDAFTAAVETIRNKAGFYFRHLPADQREDAVAETEAFALKGFRILMAQGRDPAPLAGKIAEFAARRVRFGTRFAGKVPVRDVLSADSRRRHGYHVTSLPHGDEDPVAAEVRDALGRGGPSPAEEAVTRLDYEAWLDGLDEKYRAVAEGLASGLNQSEVAQRRGVSKGRVQQMAARLETSYDEFHGGGKAR
jgi:hypothetical protein